MPAADEQEQPQPKPKLLSVRPNSILDVRTKGTQGKGTNRPFTTAVAAGGTANVFGGTQLTGMLHCANCGKEWYHRDDVKEDDACPLCLNPAHRIVFGAGFANPDIELTHRK